MEKEKALQRAFLSAVSSRAIRRRTSATWDGTKIVVVTNWMSEVKAKLGKR